MFTGSHGLETYHPATKPFQQGWLTVGRKLIGPVENFRGSWNNRGQAALGVNPVVRWVRLTSFHEPFADWGNQSCYEDWSKRFGGKTAILKIITARYLFEIIGSEEFMEESSIFSYIKLIKLIFWDDLPYSPFLPTKWLLLPHVSAPVLLTSSAADLGRCCCLPHRQKTPSWWPDIAEPACESSWFRSVFFFGNP